MNAKQLTQAELIAALDRSHWATVNRWLERGDGVAVYRNEDLGSRMLGHRQFLSFGSPQAQLEGDVPPQRLPDIGTAINWRYQLEGTYRGPALNDGDARALPLADLLKWPEKGV